MGRHPQCVGSHRDQTSSYSTSGRVLGQCTEDRRRGLDGTSPHSKQGRVAFPTLRLPRLSLIGGPVPWTKRGKRPAAVAWIGVGTASALRRQPSDRTSPHSIPGEAKPSHTRRHETDHDTKPTRPLLTNGTAMTGVIHALSTATIFKQSSRGGQRVGNPLHDLGGWPFGPPQRRPGRGCWRRAGGGSSWSNRRRRPANGRGGGRPPSLAGQRPKHLAALSKLRRRCRSPKKTKGRWAWATPVETLDFRRHAAGSLSPRQI